MKAECRRRFAQRYDHGWNDRCRALVLGDAGADEDGDDPGAASFVLAVSPARAAFEAATRRQRALARHIKERVDGALARVHAATLHARHVLAEVSADVQKMGELDAGEMAELGVDELEAVVRALPSELHQPESVRGRIRANAWRLGVTELEPRMFAVIGILAGVKPTIRSAAEKRRLARAKGREATGVKDDTIAEVLAREANAYRSDRA